MLRSIKTLSDAQKAINELQNYIETRRTKDWNFNGLKIKNAGDGIDPQDYVTLNQLNTKGPVGANPDQFYTIFLTKDGTAIDGELSPAAVICANREGYPNQVYLAAEDAPSGGSLLANILVTTYDSTGAETSQDLLAADLELTEGQTMRVFSSTLNANLKLGFGCKLQVKITTASGAGRISMGLMIKKVKAQS